MKMQISEEMEMIIAKAIVNNGLVTFNTIKNVYSSASRDKCSSTLRKLECVGYIRQTKKPGIFMVRVKEVSIGDKKKLIWNVPQEIIDMANKLQDVRDTGDIEEDLLRKYKKVDNSSDSDESIPEDDKKPSI